MNLLMTLLLAHLFADFPLQSNSLARLKETRIMGVFLHVLVHVAVTACLLKTAPSTGYYWWASVPYTL